jgi:molecular chaperone GrpE (heat shock protein)
MNRFVILALAVAAAVALPAGAQLYKYVDKNGKTVYSDQPPPDVDSKRVNVPAAGPANAPAAPKSAVEREKENQKSRKEQAEKSKKADEDAARVAQNELRCTQLKGNYEMYVQGGKIQRTNDKGERELLSDAEIEAARERTRREMEEACKK